MRTTSYITNSKPPIFAYTKSNGEACTLADPYTDIDEEDYDDYNTDEPTPIDEEPDYDTDEEPYLLHSDTILKKMN